MQAKDQVTALNTFLTLLQKRGIQLQESYSLLVKLWVIVKNGFIKNQSVEKDTSLSDIYRMNNFHLSDSISFFEHYKVSEIQLEKELLEKLCKILANVELQTLLSVVKDLKTRKAVGQYFTEEELIDKVNQKMKFKANLREPSTVVDFSAGVGYFLKPFLGENYNVYGVELDPLVFELMLFSFISQTSLSEITRAKLVLTIKQGDSLAGYQETDKDLLLSNLTLKSKFLELISLRSKLLFAEKEISTHELNDYFQKREFFSDKSPKFQKFNWFLDFPELFFDNEGNLLEEFGVDVVVGNPPWIYYKDVEEEQYRKENLDPKISTYLKGKYNFSLPFIILAYIISKAKGSLVVPQGILTESYANDWRKKVFNKRSISEIILCKRDWFEDVINEFCIILWDKKSKFSEIQLRNETDNTESSLHYSSIDQELNHLRILPKDILSFLDKIKQTSPNLDEFTSIRRGLTLTKQYQRFYENSNKARKSTELKKIIRSNTFKLDKRNGIFNFQLHFAGESFVYDKNLLGAPGTESLFEQSKIIRRNRGKLWYVGLDLEGNYYVNDIFDIIFPKTNQFSVKFIYAYLCSSLIQLLAESLLVRDITSNIVRNFPFPCLNSIQSSELEECVNIWLSSSKTVNDFLNMRKKIDCLIFDFWDFPTEIRIFIENHINLNWREIKG